MQRRADKLLLLLLLLLLLRRCTSESFIFMAAHRYDRRSQSPRTRVCTQDFCKCSMAL
jgi:hypothetical protein